MNKQITDTLKALKLAYALLWILPLGMVIGFENEWLETGVFCDDAKATYILQNVGILFMIALIPFSLRLFSLSLVRSMKERPLLDALKSYRRWSEIRLALLFVPICTNLSFYYLTFNTSSVFCVVMTLIASLFCVPTRNRLWAELDLPVDNNE